MSLKIYDSTGKLIELKEIKKLSDIADIDPTAPTADQVLVWDDVLEKWKAADAAAGVTDHGELDGLADDDHAQYLNEARHDLTDRHTLGSVVPHEAALNDIEDVDVESPVDGNVLYWDEGEGKWKFKEALAEHGADKHTNVTRYLWLPATLDVIGAGTAIAEATADVPVLEVANDAEKKVYLPYFRCPDDFVSFTSAKLLWYAVHTGNMYWRLSAAYGAAGELMTQHQDNPAYGATTGTGAGSTDLQAPENVLTLADLAKGDFVSIRYERDGTNELDTIADTGEVELLGILIEYIAEQ